MACGETGTGRLPETEIILDIILQKINFFTSKKKVSKIFEKKLKNKKILITAGPTQEIIDPVRFISNNSSGKQGYEIAELLQKHGAIVTLITGPTKVTLPKVEKTILVKSASEMLTVVKNNLPTDIFIGVAKLSLIGDLLHTIKI